MFMLFGRGGRNSWVLRLGLLALVIGAGSTFGHRGNGYLAFRGLYYLLILSFVGTAIWRNRSRQGGGRTRGSGIFSGPSGTTEEACRLRSAAGTDRTSRRGVGRPSSPADHPPSVPAGAPPEVAGAQPSFPAGSPPSVTAGPPPAPPGVAHPAADVAVLGQTSLSGPGQQPGWYPDALDPMARHYWDGAAWTQRLKWDGKTWIPA